MSCWGKSRLSISTHWHSNIRHYLLFLTRKSNNSSLWSSDFVAFGGCKGPLTDLCISIFYRWLLPVQDFCLNFNVFLNFVQCRWEDHTLPLDGKKYPTPVDPNRVELPVSWLVNLIAAYTTCFINLAIAPSSNEGVNSLSRVGRELEVTSFEDIFC